MELELCMDGCKPPCELKLGPLQDQQVLLTVESSLASFYAFLVEDSVRIMLFQEWQVLHVSSN